MGDSARLDDFVAFSSAATGFSEFHLRGTGLPALYLSTLDEVVGEEVVGQLLAAFDVAAGSSGEDQAALQRGMRREVFGHEKLGPVARALLKLWYVGTWYELPADWRERYGQSEKDRSFVVSAGSYTEGLLWPAIGANPPGAKPPGYGTWAEPPRISAT